MRSFEVVDARILVAVDCEVPPGGLQHRFMALLDTGAQITSISSTVIETLAVRPVGTLPIRYPSGNRQVHDAFWLRVGIAGLPHARGAAYVVHIEPGSPDYAVILGMDILVHYDIAISGGQCTITTPTPAH
ncbi:MAG: hypothetical protein F4046_01440 [Acidimicrobiaceae bacterium]|nr:hypothetical protein [Acidimicrobiaceae bacterium]